MVYTNRATDRTITTDAAGRVKHIETPVGLGGNMMVINRGERGGRMVESGRPGARVVSYGPNRGFVERPLRSGYISRTYVVGGRSYAHVYREYHYRGVVHYRYVPAVYYGPRFYAWAVTPWGDPVRYAWYGLAEPAPWFAYYPGYFTPYPAYDSADMWLTDYLITENLKLAYENEKLTDDQSAPPPQPASVALSPQVKAAIDQEVKEQLTEEAAANHDDSVTQAAFPSPEPANEVIPASLTKDYRVFPVVDSLELTLFTGQTCTVTPGDVLQRITDMPDGNQNVFAIVVSSKAGDCAQGQTVVTPVQDLDEILNRMREQIDAGMGQLVASQVSGVHPPDAAVRQAAEGTAEPTSDATAALQNQENQAANVESQVTSAN